MCKVFLPTTMPHSRAFFGTVFSLILGVSLLFLGACSSSTAEVQTPAGAAKEMGSTSKPESVSVAGSLDIPVRSGALPQLTKDDLAWYADPIAGFVGKVPLQWKKVVISDFLYQGDEPQNYAITFESALTHAEDSFADYLMIEMTPGAQANAFLIDPEQSVDIRIDGVPAKLQMLHLDRFEIGAEELDLVVFQLTISQVGYSIGIYAVGRKEEANRLHFVMQEFVRSFRFPVDPYRVS